MARRILVVGGGVAGLTAAIAFGVKGYLPTVVELHGRPHGSGLGIGGRALEVLDDLGVAMPLLAHSTPTERMVFCDKAGNIVNETPYAPSNRPNLPPHATMSRAALAQVLNARAAELGIDLRIGVTWSALDQQPDGVRATLTDGTEQTYDFVIVADGAYSRTREQIVGAPVELEFLKQGSWRWMTPWAESQPTGRTYMTPDVKMGAYPLPDGQVYLFATQNFEKKPWMDEDRLGELFGAVLDDFDVPSIREYRARIDGPEGITFRPLEAYLMPDPWAKGRMVAIGDAAHTLAPHLASGAGLAIEDAWVLADCVSADADWDQAIRRFMARRYDRTRHVSEASNALCDWKSTEDFTGRRAEARVVLELPL
ncbi:MAG: FAD-dependent monooxygenase [Sphingomonas bacterium]